MTWEQTSLVRISKNGSSPIGSGDLDMYRRFLKEADLPENDNHMEATALENGFVPERSGLAAVDLKNNERFATHCTHGVQAETTYQCW